MPLRPRILDILERADDPAALQALGAALPLVDAVLQCQIIDILIARAEDPGLAAILDSFDRLDKQVQTTVIARASHLFGALRLTIRSPHVQTRLNTLVIIRRCCNPRLAYLAASAVRDGSSGVRAEAARTLRELTDQHRRAHHETAALLRDAADGDDAVRLPIIQTLRLLREEHQHLVAAIKETLDHFESHLRPEILESAMYLAEELEGSLFQEETRQRGKLTQAMMEIYGNSPSPQLAAFTYIALGYPELRRKIVTVLAGLRSPEFFIEFIRCQWLARDPRICRNLCAIRSLAWLSDGFEAAFTLPPDVAALAPPWIAVLGLPADHKVKLLTSFLLIDNASANLAAACALAKLATPAAKQALRGVMDYDDPRIRRIAQRAIQAPRPPVHRAQGTPPPPDRPAAWSALVEQSGLTEDFDDFWLNFERIPPELAGSAGPLAVQFVPAFQTHMQVKLIAPHPADRMRALQFLAELHVTDRFCKEVFAAANDAVADVRVAAMQALGSLSGPAARRILERALVDAAPQVQAAAIDALDRIRAPRRTELLLPMTKSDDAGIRAAAVRALLKLHVPKAASALIAMLEEARVEHRCSALWVVEQLGLAVMAPRIAEMVEHDSNPRVARIAQHVLRKLQEPNLRRERLVERGQGAKGPRDQVKDSVRRGGLLPALDPSAPGPLGPSVPQPQS